MKIKIKYHDPELIRLEKIDKGDFVDLRSAEDVFIPEYEFRLISLGVSMELPEGHYAEVVPRSSTYKNFGIIMTNSIGIIDESYAGDNDIWRFPALCMRGDSEYRGVKGTWIHKNDRIAQFRVVKKMPSIAFDEVETLENKSRGGFGSTGVK